jgi:hypothetical protein
MPRTLQHFECLNAGQYHIAPTTRVTPLAVGGSAGSQVPSSPAAKVPHLHLATPCVRPIRGFRCWPRSAQSHINATWRVRTKFLQCRAALGSWRPVVNLVIALWRRFVLPLVPIPKGLCPPAQGCEARATLGETVGNGQPQRVCCAILSLHTAAACAPRRPRC